MVILACRYLSILIFFWSKFILAADVHIHQVSIDCIGGACHSLEVNLNGFKGQKVNLNHLRERLKVLSLDRAIKSFHFELLKDKRVNENIISLYIQTLPRINKINFTSNIPVDTAGMGTSVFRERGFFNQSNIDVFKSEIVRRIQERGYHNVSVDLDWEIENDLVEIDVRINIGSVSVFDKITLSADLPQVLKLYRHRLDHLRGKVWDPVEFRVAIEALQDEIMGDGFWQVSIDHNVEIQEERTNVHVEIHFGKRFHMHFRGNNIFSRPELIEVIRQDLITYDEYSIDIFKERIANHYNDKGFFHSEIKIESIVGKTKFDVPFINIYFEIMEGVKIPIEHISFIGNNHFTNREIERLFKRNGSLLIRRSFLDRQYLEEFEDILKEKYLKDGFVSVNISSPDIRIENGRALIFYRINERQQSIIGDIKIDGIPEELRKELLLRLVNQVGRPINIVEVANDVESVVRELSQKGYYYARIVNFNRDNLVQYDRSLRNVTIYLDVDLGKKTIFQNVIVSGLEKTNKRVVTREVRLRKGDIITAEMVDEIQQRLSFLGLFSQVSVSPFVINRGVEGDDYFLADILVQVQEKDFGLIEVAPGYRTDIGVKLSTDVSYNNLWGMNRAVSFRAQVNQRLDFANLDARRREEEKRILEFSLRTNYSEPYLFDTLFQFDLTTSYQRRRFFSFDADIFRVSPEINRRIGRHFNVGLKYQLETIRQFDATELRDEDSFRIGSMVPSVSADFRDDQIMPSRGAHFSVIWEYANPAFGSINDDDLEVNFHKIMSRNSFYLPINEDWTIASSIAFGYQENRARDIRTDGDGNPIVDDAGNILRSGFIPSIKVFRLDGIDNLRGFSDREANRLRSGQDIGQVLVQDQAYYLNLKLEPRYRVSDNIMMAVFLDAGRVYVDSFRPTDLRSAAGLSFKIVTPVGTLDFDYGVKLHRKFFPELGKESYGRFHLSIGHF